VTESVSIYTRSQGATAISRTNASLAPNGIVQGKGKFCWQNVPQLQSCSSKSQISQTCSGTL